MNAHMLFIIVKISKKKTFFIENNNNSKMANWISENKLTIRQERTGPNTMVSMIIGLINKEGYHTYTLKSGWKISVAYKLLGF
jgi:hypothetical protein